MTRYGTFLVSLGSVDTQLRGVPRKSRDVYTSGDHCGVDNEVTLCQMRKLPVRECQGRMIGR